MVTILDVAEFAGVSKSTVSLVINGSPLVKAQTREKVERAIDRLGYVCNNNARGLRRRETKCLGIIVAAENKAEGKYGFEYETGLFSYNITNGIPLGLAGTDYGLMTERYYAYEAEDKLPDIVKNGRIDGLFLVGGLFDDNFIEKLLEKNIPTVAVGKYYDKIDCVYPDVKQGTYRQVKYLTDRGHKNIAFINCPKAYTSSMLRLSGFEEACGGKCNMKWSEYCESNTGEGGYNAIKRLWDRGARPDAVATANEPIALGVMRFFYEKGIRIPEDISLVSYENSVLGGYAAPPLTSVNIHKEEMGKLAASMLLRRMENPEEKVESKVIMPEIVEGGSVKNLN